MTTSTKWSAQLIGALLCALGLKVYYSSASPDELRWILAPTTWLVELLSGRSFSFEAHAGYMSSDHSFLIAGSCAGVNFLITAFLMLALKTLWAPRESPLGWKFIPFTALIAYVATIVTNSVRIYLALQLKGLKGEIDWLTPNQLHRAEGIFVYFIFLLLLYMITEKQQSEKAFLWKLRFPLLVYYSITLVLPFMNGGYKRGFEFWEHSFFVLAIPLITLLPVMVLSWLYRNVSLRFCN
jgi:exosortase K